MTGAMVLNVPLNAAVNSTETDPWIVQEVERPQCDQIW